MDVPGQQGKIVHDRPPMLAIGVMIWLGSELMFFSGLFAAFFTIRANTSGLAPAGTHLDTLRAGIFTLVLVSSSFTMQYAVSRPSGASAESARHLDRRARSSSGALPRQPGLRVALQPTRWYTNAYGSLFFIMTGLHGLHVFIGLVAMVFLLGRMKGASAATPASCPPSRGSATTGTSSTSSGSGSTVACSSSSRHARRAHIHRRGRSSTQFLLAGRPRWSSPPWRRLAMFVPGADAGRQRATPTPPRCRPSADATSPTRGLRHRSTSRASPSDAATRATRSTAATRVLPATATCITYGNTRHHLRQPAAVRSSRPASCSSPRPARAATATRPTA